MTVPLTTLSLQYCVKLFTIKIINLENYLVNITVEVLIASFPYLSWNLHILALILARESR